MFRPSGVTATASARQADQLSVFPNPTTGSFTLRLAAAVPGQQADATLYNALGQVVRRQPVSVLATGLQAEFSAAGLPVGVYTLRLTLADGTFLTKRLIKQ
ncbi:T9SS type A sorting domain-containing protein [Hymenobacter sp. 15J16-1T3B]|nr:T9SS type A sorting domain-containing protein [Hymenobacter sp. 15J16-1T3B]